jgi:hypothetical protein
VSEETTTLVVNQDGTIADVAPSDIQMNDLSDYGFILPVASPEKTREALAMRQRIYAAILDPLDYLYCVSFKDHGKPRQYISNRREDAQKVADTHKAPLLAKPKKSGIVKLADALNIEGEILNEEWKENPADGTWYFEVTYKAIHRRTGRSALGKGACDKSERGGRISTHDILTTADTRAFNRAVLRLSGFGDVSADEIIAGASFDDDIPAYVPQADTLKTPDARPASDDEQVVAASRAWAEAITAREGERWLPSAQQDTKQARELRAQGRRGDVRAAQQMGVMGLQWNGTAQDSLGHRSFPVADAPIKPSDLAAVLGTPETPADPKANGKGAGWDLSSQGSDKDDTAPIDRSPPTPANAPDPTLREVAANIPAPNPNTEVITTAQAKNVSKLLLEVFSGSKEEARAWLKAAAGTESSRKLRLNQYEPTIAALNEKKGNDA